MTTHVFVVDEKTFKCHLEYLFVGTGATTKDVDFNNNPTTKLYSGKKHASENGLVAMMADGARIRKDDFIIFYVQASKTNEGKFYGIFQAASDDIFLERYCPTQYLLSNLGKNLTFRQCIKPYKVYSEGVTEWEALDEIKHLCAPQQMLWSLIYRKLRANRGNTMITLYEAKRLFNLIATKNHNAPFTQPISGLTYNGSRIIVSSSNFSLYKGKKTPIVLLPRLAEKFSKGLAHESHLQQYIVQNIGKGTNLSLDDALKIHGKKIEWIGNEVACGVGMQRIDVMLSIKESEMESIVMPIELKAVPVEVNTVFQLDRYIDWIEQYYTSNMPSTIQPVLICRGNSFVSSAISNSFLKFDTKHNGRCSPVAFIQYDIFFDKSGIPSINFKKIK